MTRDEEEHYVEMLGGPNDISPEQVAYDLLHKHDDELSNCCGERINSQGFCTRCLEHAEVMEFDDDAF